MTFQKSLAWTINPRGGVSEVEENNIVTYLDTKGCKYAYVIETASQRHMHIGVLGLKNQTALFRKYMSTQYPQVFPWEDRLTWLKVKTWYKPTSEPVTTPDGSVSEYKSWMDYMMKDGELKVNTLPDNYISMLDDNIEEKDRRKRDIWPVMAHFENKFKEHDLLFATFEDVSIGVSKLAFVIREVKPPDAAKLKGFLLMLWKYMNQDGTCVLESADDYMIQSEFTRKRKRLEAENEFEAHCVEVGVKKLNADSMPWH